MVIFLFHTLLLSYYLYYFYFEKFKYLNFLNLVSQTDKIDDKKFGKPKKELRFFKNFCFKFKPRESWADTI